MPELPEVETVKNTLLPYIKNQTIDHVEILRSVTVEGDENEFVSTLKDKKILDLSRIGKFLIFHLSDDYVVVSHLRMEGKYYVFNSDENNSKYARLVWFLKNNTKICYDDSRCFGMMILSKESEYRSLKELAKLGQEPWDVKDINALYLKANKSSTPIKTLLLSQELITGLGNIYVDEVLYACKIHPLTPGKNISLEDWSNIVKESSRILKEAIVSGGSTIKSYHPGKGIDGEFQTKLLAYGKEGEPCIRCNTSLRKIKVGGRGTTFCPKCQRIKSNKLAVAIYGSIGSGKTTLLNIYKDSGYKVISCDQIVHDLYQNKDVVNKVYKALKIEPNELSVNDNIRKHLINYPKDKNKLERIIWPLVDKEVAKFISSNKKGIAVVEVPLLFEAKMESRFDVIIGIKSDLAYVREENRDKEKAQELKNININHKFDKHINDMDYIIENNSSIKDLKKKALEVINTLQEGLN